MQSVTYELTWLGEIEWSIQQFKDEKKALYVMRASLTSTEEIAAIDQRISEINANLLELADQRAWALEQAHEQQRYDLIVAMGRLRGKLIIDRFLADQKPKRSKTRLARIDRNSRRLTKFEIAYKALEGAA